MTLNLHQFNSMTLWSTTIMSGPPQWFPLARSPHPLRNLHHPPCWMMVESHRDGAFSGIDTILIQPWIKQHFWSWDLQVSTAWPDINLTIPVFSAHLLFLGPSLQIGLSMAWSWHRRRSEGQPWTVCTPTPKQPANTKSVNMLGMFSLDTLPCVQLVLTIPSC